MQPYEAIAHAACDHAAMLAEDRNAELVYEFDSRPDAGYTMPIVPGIDWLRMPLPFSLAHINLWLLDDGENFAIVDTGVCVDEAQGIWHDVIDTVKAGRPLSRVLVTHLHPDHVGCAGWLCEQFDVPLWMSRSEYLLCRILVADTGRPTPPAGLRFYTAAGFDTEHMAYYQKMFGMFGKYVSPVPESYRRMQEGERIAIGEFTWEVIVGRGHSPEHVCLYCEDQNLLISGDQLLPTISSNVSVYPTEPDANPLADWMQSLTLLKARIPADVLVLPAHGKPFRGAHARLDALLSEHNACLDELLRFCKSPKRAVDVFPALFKAKITKHNLIMATGESVAHLNYLLDQRLVSVSQDNDGVDWYVASH